MMSGEKRTHLPIPNGKRSQDKGYMVLLGLTGAGKSSTVNSLIDLKCTGEDGIFRSATQSILEYKVALVTELGTFPKNLILIDTPGFQDTESGKPNEKDAQILATLDDFLGRHKDLSVCYPSALLLVIDFSDTRIDAEKSFFIQFLKALEELTKRGILIDKSPTTCNLIIVLTHYMNEDDEELRKWPESRIRLIQGLIKTFTTIPANVPVIMAENKGKLFKLKMYKDSYILPNGDRYPLNLFKSLITMEESDKIQEIINDVFVNSRSMTKITLSEKMLVDMSSDVVVQYLIIIKNTNLQIQENEMTRILDEVWQSLNEGERGRNKILLQIAKVILCNAGIDSNSKIPEDADVILALLRQLAVNSTLEKVLLHVGINPPNLQQYCKSVGCFYNIKLNSVKDTPFNANSETITHAGFLAPEFMRADIVGNADSKKYIGLVCHDSQQKYNVDRLANLQVEFVNGSKKIDVPVTPGHNIVSNGEQPRQITGIREYREYTVSLTKNFRFGSAYINELKGLPPRSSDTAWLRHFADYGTHILSFAYLGGSFSVTATKKGGVGGASTSVERVKQIIRFILEKAGTICGGNIFEPVPDWEFEVHFFGGDPTKAKPRMSTLFRETGKLLFNKWVASIKLHPCLLVSELYLEPIHVFLNRADINLSHRVSLAAHFHYGFMKCEGAEEPREIPRRAPPPKSGPCSIC